MKISVWIADWMQECCGPVRTVGNAVDLELTFYGETTPTTGPGQVISLADGRVDITAKVAGPVWEDGDEDGPAQGVLAECGGLRFAVPGWHQAAGWVHCVGRLWDRAHDPAGQAAGKLVGIRWRPRLAGPPGDSYAIGGYQEGEEINSTEFRPQPGDGAFEFVISQA
jgi:hypothetical protein